jgi:hypothetical protein
MDTAPPTHQKGICSKRWRDFCRFGIIAVPFLYFFALVQSDPGKPSWVSWTLIIGLLLQLILPFALLVLSAFVLRTKSSELIIDLSVVFLGLAAEAVMIYFLIVFMAVGAGC